MSERRISIEPVLDPIHPSQLGTLGNLFELYAYDFSSIVPIEVGLDGRFGSDCEVWLREPGRAAYFIRAERKLAGFALVRRGSLLRDDARVMDVGEFFILRYMRRRGLGKLAAHAMFARQRGPWEVRVHLHNHGALAFWTDAVAEASNGRHHSEDRRDGDFERRVFSFDNSVDAGEESAPDAE